ncbi:glycosyltransferase [Hymenobacter sp.]|uniref:glycosyltransferase family 2 protein n=1 Tax=Hymenobacter sp. TaxID=1898978 RepID=UPI00286BEB61|nr:glycosyltransferase [Hymenobacter sp.]
MQPRSPLVSVIIPNYNHARFLPQRIESVLQQTYQNLNVLLLDDCSTDDSRTVLARYAQKSPRIELMLNERNSGSTFRQWNKGLARATGTYVWIAESDDAAEPTLLARLVACLEANPAAVMAYCQSRLIDAQGQPEGLALLLADGLGHTDYCRPGRELVEQYMPITNIVANASAVLVRRSALAAVGPAPEDMRLAGDWLFWIRLMLEGQVCYVAEPLNLFRTHGQNVRSQAQGVGLVEMARVLGYLRRTVAIDVVTYRHALVMLTERWFQTFIYSPLTREVHQRFMAEMRKFEPGFGRIFAQVLVARLFRSRLSGFKMLVGDKLLGRHGR